MALLCQTHTKATKAHITPLKVAHISSSVAVQSPYTSHQNFNQKIKNLSFKYPLEAYWKGSIRKDNKRQI